MQCYNCTEVNLTIIRKNTLYSKKNFPSFPNFHLAFEGRCRVPKFVAFGLQLAVSQRDVRFPTNLVVSEGSIFGRRSTMKTRGSGVTEGRRPSTSATTTPSLGADTAPHGLAAEHFDIYKGLFPKLFVSKYFPNSLQANCLQ